MKKTVLAIIFVMMLALAVTASAEVETFTPNENGLFTIDYDLSKAGLSDVEDGTMFGMVVIEAAEGAEFALTEGSIRYIDQGEASEGALLFSGFAPMDLKEDGQYQVYIGGEGLSAAKQIGILGTEEDPGEDPGEDPVDPPVDPPVVEGVPGDMDGSGVLDEDDAVHLLFHYLIDEDMFPLSGDGDVDGSGVLDEDDAVYLLFHYLIDADMFPLYPTL